LVLKKIVNYSHNNLFIELEFNTPYLKDECSIFLLKIFTLSSSIQSNI